MITFNNVVLDSYFTCCEVIFDRCFLYQNPIKEDYVNKEMENGKVIKIKLYRKKYREDLDNYIKWKMTIMNCCFTSSAYWLQSNKNDYFYGYFTNVEEEIKSDYTSFLTLTFTSLYPFSFTYKYITNTSLHGDAMNTPKINFFGNTLIEAEFTNNSSVSTYMQVVTEKGGNWLKINNNAETGYLSSKNRVVINKSYEFPNCYYYRQMYIQFSSLGSYGTFNVVEAHCFTAQEKLQNEGKLK